MDEGHIVVDSVARITLADVTDTLARESGFSSVKDLLETARHGRGENVYLVRFHYLPPGGWDVPRAAGRNEDRAKSRSRASSERAELLRRIRNATTVKSRKGA
jgi:hypothetical protein